MAKRHSNGNGAVRAVLYLRMSSAEQEFSIDQQRTELRKLAKRLGYVIVGEYLDEAISGDATEQRSGFLAMRDDAESGKFDVILAWDQDRFGRFDPLDAGYWIYPFRRAGVRLETIAQGQIDWEDLTGQLVYSVNQLGKAQFLRDLSRNTVRGLAKSAREGTNGTGGMAPQGLREDPDRAEIVRRIFADYLEPGASVRSVMVGLNRDKVKPARGKRWSTNTVRYILGNEKYTGSYVYGKTNTGRYHSLRVGEIVPRSKSDKIDEAEPIVHRDRFEPVVDQETFDRVQAKLAKMQGNTAKRTARQYVFSRLVRCGDCGGSMAGKPNRGIPSYRCQTLQRKGTGSCYCNTMREDRLLDVVSRKIQSEFLSDRGLDRLRKALDREQRQEQRQPSKAEVNRLRKAIEKLDAKLDAGADTVLDAPPQLRPTLYRKLDDLRQERDRLNADLQALTAHESNGRKSDGKVVDRCIKALRKLGETLRKATPETFRELIQGLVSGIELHYKHERSGKRWRNEFTHGTIFVRPDNPAIMNQTRS